MGRQILILAHNLPKGTCNCLANFYGCLIMLLNCSIRIGVSNIFTSPAERVAVLVMQSALFLLWSCLSLETPIDSGYLTQPPAVLSSGEPVDPGYLTHLSAVLSSGEPTDWGYLTHPSAVLSSGEPIDCYVTHPSPVLSSGEPINWCYVTHPSAVLSSGEPIDWCYLTHPSAGAQCHRAHPVT